MTPGALRFTASLGGVAAVSGIAVGLLFDDLHNALIAIAVLAGLTITALGVRSVWLAHRKVGQIFDDELDGPDESEEQR